MKQSPLSQTRTLGALLSLFALAVSFSACSRSGVGRIDPNPTTGNHNINVYLSDAPADFQQVFVDIQKVEVKVDLDRSHEDDDQYAADDIDSDDIEEADEYGRWVTLNFAPQVMDVLALRNGIERLLGNASVPTRVRKIRFTLGDRNWVVDGDGLDWNLSLNNDTQNSLYMHVTSVDMDNSLPGNIDLRVDMDLAKSIEMIGDTYYLHPQFRLFNIQRTGSVTGYISPIQMGARVTIVDQSGFEAGAIPSSEDGFFRIRGLVPGVLYTIKVDAPGLHTYERRDVVVERQSETELGEITL